MTPTATYIAEENSLQEMPQFGPLKSLFDNGLTEEGLLKGKAYLATLRKIPCSPEPGFKDGEKYTEGVDYEIKGAGDWKWCYQLKGNIFAAPIVPVKSEPDMPNLILTAFQNEPVNFLLSNALRHLTQDQQRELCNALQERLPIPASFEQEAERLYPDDKTYDGVASDFSKNDVSNAQRSAHITAARQYMGEIEKLTDQNHKLMAENDTLSEELGELKEIQQGVEKLRAENSKMRKALEGLSQFGGYVGTLATSALK